MGTKPQALLPTPAVQPIVTHKICPLHLSWLLPVTLVFCMCSEMASKKICSMTFLGTKVRLSGLMLPGSSFLRFPKMDVMFAFLQPSGTSTNCHGLSKMLQKGLTIKFTASLAPSEVTHLVPLTYVCIVRLNDP